MARKKKKAAKRKTTKKKAVKKTARKKRRGVWTPEQVKLLKKLFPNTPTIDIAKKVRKKVDAVKKKASRMGLRKNKTYLKKIGRA